MRWFLLLGSLVVGLTVSLPLAARDHVLEGQTPVASSTAVVAPSVPAKAPAESPLIHYLALVLGIAGTFLIGHLTVPIGKVLLNLNTWVDHLPDLVKRLLIAVIAAALTALGVALTQFAPAGFQVPTDLTSLSSPTVLATLLATLVAFVKHLDDASSGTSS